MMSFIFQYLDRIEAFGVLCAYWIGLGILSSVGLGTGLHTFLLYLVSKAINVLMVVALVVVVAVAVAVAQTCDDGCVSVN